MTNHDAALAMDAARMRLNHDRGYLQAVLWAVRIVPTEDVSSMAMSKDAVVYYNPREVLKWSLEARVLVLYEEICHWMRKHYERMLPFPNLELVHIAVDLEVLGDLEEEINRDRNLEWPPCGSVVPGWPPFEDMPRGKLAEEYYRLLERKRKQSGGNGQGRPQRQRGQGQPQCQRGQGQGQQGQQQRGRQGQSQQGQSQQDQRDRQPQQGQQQDGPGSMPSQGSVSDGRWKDWEEQNHPEGITEAQGRLIARKLAQDIQEAAERDKSIGSVPAWMRRWAEMQLSSWVPWHKVLDRWIRQAIGHVLGYSDYDFRVPNRRAALSGLILPGLVKPVPRIAVVLDTSGSMSRVQIGLALAEIGGVLKAMGMMEGVWVLATDAEAHTCQRVFNPRRVEIVGGGGTVLESGIARAMKLRPRPEIVIIISDCHNYWEDAKPARASIVVVRVGSGKAPAWADKVIDVDEMKAGEYGAVWAR